MKDSATTSMNPKYNRCRTSDASTIVSTNEADWMERASGKINKLLHKHACMRLCNLYADEQVAFENQQQSDDYVTTMDRMMQDMMMLDWSGGNGIDAGATTTTPGATAAGMLGRGVFLHHAAAATSCMQVELYRQFLFDEASVYDAYGDQWMTDDPETTEDDFTNRPPSLTSPPAIQGVPSHDTADSFVTQRTH